MLTKQKQLSVVFTTKDSPKQRVGRAECTEEIGDDYATAEEYNKPLLMLFNLGITSTI